MSINHFLNKIKGQIGIDTTTIICLFVIVLVGLSSFGLGRLSVTSMKDNYVSELENKNIGLVKGEMGETTEVKNEYSENTKQRMYVASKNGKLYYSLNCSGAKRISEKNKVWFADEIEAEKSGYELSSSCK